MESTIRLFASLKKASAFSVRPYSSLAHDLLKQHPRIEERPMLKHLSAYFSEIKKYSYAIEQSEKKVTEIGFSAMGQCLQVGIKHMKPGVASIRDARENFVEAIKLAGTLAERVLLLGERQKQSLSNVYAYYANFLKKTTTFDEYDQVRYYIAKAKSLDPTNKEANHCQQDMSYNFGP